MIVRHYNNLFQLCSCIYNVCRDVNAACEIQAVCLLVHGLNSHLNLFPLKGEPVKREDIFVAVKTCRKFHSDRGACATPTLPERFPTDFLSLSLSILATYFSSSQLSTTTKTAYLQIYRVQIN